MGKAQSKRSVDITTETKKGTEDQIIEKMEKIEDLDKKETVNGDATTSEKNYAENKGAEQAENNKDLTTEKDIDVQGIATDSQNTSEASKEGGCLTPAEEISPILDESIKKSKKEKVKKKWSFRNISFGKKDKQKPAKNEDTTQDAATNEADAEEKTINETEDTEKDNYANGTEEKTKEVSHDNGNSTPQEINGVGQIDKPSDIKSNDITANAINNTTNTDTCEPVQKETAAISAELSEKTESTDVITQAKLSEKTSVDEMSTNANGIDEKINTTDQAPQTTDVINTSVENLPDKTNALGSAVRNESSVTTNGDVVDQIHQNGDHGESEQEFIEKSKAQIEVNSNTDKVSAATLNFISSTSINPSNVQIRNQNLSASSEKPDEITQINNIDFVITEISSSSTDQSSLYEIVSMLNVENNVQIEAISDIISEVIDSVKLSQETFYVDPSPPPLPISPPPSQVSVFAFTNNDESVDSIELKDFKESSNNKNKEEKQLFVSPLKKLPIIEITNSKANEAMPTEKFDELPLQFHGDEANTNVQKHCQEHEKEINKVGSICKNNEKISTDHVGIKEDVSAVIAAVVIGEITEKAAEIVNQQLKYNAEQITDNFSSQSNEERKGYAVKTQSIYLKNSGNKGKNNEYSSNEPLPVTERTSEYLLNFTTCDSIQHCQNETNSLKKSDNLEEKHLEPTKEFGIAKDIKDNVTQAEKTQELSVTCE